MVERGDFFEGGREPFPGGKKVPFPLKLPPSFQKPLICCFAPQGNPYSGTYSARKKSGKNAAGNDYFVSKAPARQVSVRRGGREDGYPPLHPRKERACFPAHHDRPACGACPDLPPPHDKGRPSASSLLPSGLRPATLKKRPSLRAASDERVLGKEGATPNLYLS